jgi:hypothetical protein
LRCGKKRLVQKDDKKALAQRMRDAISIPISTPLLADFGRPVGIEDALDRDPLDDDPLPHQWRLHRSWSDLIGSELYHVAHAGAGGLLRQHGEPIEPQIGRHRVVDRAERELRYGCRPREEGAQLTKKGRHQRPCPAEPPTAPKVA